MDPIIIISALVAAFFIFRLASVLGTRTGHERRPDLEAAEAARAAASNDAGREEAAPVQKPELLDFPGATDLLAAEPEFRRDTFLTGARGAYEMIVTAIARGDLDTIQPFVSAAVFDAFKAYVDQRAARGEVGETQIIGIEDARIERADLREGLIRIAVSYRSDQVRVTRDGSGQVVSGDPERVDLVRDRWTFERPIGSRDPNWTLVATGAG